MVPAPQPERHQAFCLADVVKSGIMWVASIVLCIPESWQDRHVAGPPKSCCFTKFEGPGPADLGRAVGTGDTLGRGVLVSPRKAIGSTLLASTSKLRKAL